MFVIVDEEKRKHEQVENKGDRTTPIKKRQQNEDEK